jgi:NAD(P)-dependent dehydrogenase (short-subunit alcohol dehydrogenase family)
MQYLEASAGVTIVNVASWHGGNATISNFSAYASSKAGVIGLTRSVALEGAPRGIRVNAVCPRIIDTPMWRKSLSEFENPSELQRVVSQKHPLGHIGEPEDVAAAIAFLASDEAKFITGTTLFVDGGMSVQLPHVFDTS